MMLGQLAIVHAQTDPRILIEAMQANRESINPLECDYSVTNYEAASLRDALQGRMRETKDERFRTLRGVLKLRDETVLAMEGERQRLACLAGTKAHAYLEGMMGCLL